MSNPATINIEEAHQLLDTLSPEELSEVAQFMITLKSPTKSWDEVFANAPVEDEELKPEFIKSLLAAQEEAKQSKLTPHEDILREFGLLK